MFILSLFIYVLSLMVLLGWWNWTIKNALGVVELVKSQWLCTHILTVNVYLMMMAGQSIYYLSKSKTTYSNLALQKWLYQHLTTVYTKYNRFCNPLCHRHFGDWVTKISDLVCLTIARNSEQVKMDWIPNIFKILFTDQILRPSLHSWQKVILKVFLKSFKFAIIMKLSHKKIGLLNPNFS